VRALALLVIPLAVGCAGPPLEQRSEPVPRAEPGYLIASTVPQHAHVLIDGKDTGRITPIPPTDKLSVVAGDHLLSFVLNGASREYRLLFRSGETQRVSAFLGGQ
jgi:hypothetical protein